LKGHPQVTTDMGGQVVLLRHASLAGKVASSRTLAKTVSKRSRRTPLLTGDLTLA
jgi:hypothetical protein